MKSSYLQERLSNITSIITSFNNCKQYLSGIILNTGTKGDVARALPNYEQCALNLDCKLAQWKAHAHLKKTVVDEKLKLSQNQMWWTEKFCKYFSLDFHVLMDTWV